LAITEGLGAGPPVEYETIYHVMDNIERQAQLSYNPLLMALLWESLATRETRLLNISMRQRSHIDPRCAWVNYVRSHDDIGWTFDDGDARRVGIDPFGHRQFLNAFYTGRFPGSFARGLPFQENPRTGDARITGTAASLAGLEQAVHDADPAEIELSVRRILLLYGVALTIGGISLIYLGDEMGALNDYGYRDDPAREDDSRWVHRPRTDWLGVARRDDPTTVEGRVYAGLARLIALRKGTPALADGALEIISDQVGQQDETELPAVMVEREGVPDVQAIHDGQARGVRVGEVLVIVLQDYILRPIFVLDADPDR